MNINELEEENEDLKMKILDLSFELNYNKQNELIEFLRDLYGSLNLEDLEKLSKEDIIQNLRNYIENFAKDNKIML